jgi:hypothetical protein
MCDGRNVIVGFYLFFNGSPPKSVDDKYDVMIRGNKHEMQSTCSSRRIHPGHAYP